MFTAVPTFSSQAPNCNGTQMSNNFEFVSLNSDGNPIKRLHSFKIRKLVFRPPYRVEPQQPSHLSNKLVNHFSQEPINVVSCSQSQSCWNYSQNDDSAVSVNGQQLHSVAELPLRFQRIFKAFRHFNAVQSTVFNDIYNCNKSVVVCAPTGSGKTVIMELAIVSLLRQTISVDENTKIVYMAPIKALCNERFEDWNEKFKSFGIKCAELTGDTETDDYNTIQKANLIFTTPEKWDSTTRRWHDAKSLVSTIKLFLIDEIHVVNDESRGATIEAVISRMLTINACHRLRDGMRLIAVSATIPNVEDFAVWFESTGKPAISHKLSDELRPVKLRKVVLGYFCSEKWTNFKFDLNLSYKLSSVIHTYSDGKPTLVFCSTRKGAMQAASVLIAEMKYRLTPEQKQNLTKFANTSVKDNKLKEAISCGIGFHHAGLEVQDRKTVEQLFNEGSLLVLTSTSTLAMGINMPAHLVVIKCTTSFVAGVCTEYSNTQILQMIGRAGRPQFDSSATAVIMTKDSLKAKYEKFLNGIEVVESRLHNSFAEYLNAEVVLSTITNLSIAMQWIRSTFFYVRVLKNPQYYGIEVGFNKEETEEKLKEMCLKELNSLHDSKIIQMDEKSFDLKTTEYGRLMARFCVSLDTTKKFVNLKGSETIKDLIQLISTCKEFSDIQLRVSEKKSLNALNSDKNLPTIRFSLEGKIRTREMKIDCLIQAVFGCLPLQDVTLNQESMRITRIGQRLAKFLCEIVFLDQNNNVKSLIASLNFAKCFKAKLWENSSFIARQLDRIGITMATALANAGLKTFEKIEQTNPRQLELIVNRHPPFGNYIREAIANLPKCELKVDQTENYHEMSAEIIVFVSSTNHLGESKKQITNPTTVLVIGDRDNKIVLKQKLGARIFQDGNVWSKQLTVSRSQKGDELTIHLISDHYVGLDVVQTFSPKYKKGGTPQALMWSRYKQMKDDEVIVNPPVPSANTSSYEISVPSPSRRSCNHHCRDKKSCSHDCCKAGVVVKLRKTPCQRKANKQSAKVENERTKLRQMTIENTVTKCDQMSTCHFDEVRLKGTDILKKQRELNVGRKDHKSVETDAIASNLQRFQYKPNVNYYKGARNNIENPGQLEKPNFEIFLESDFDDSSEIDDLAIVDSSSECKVVGLMDFDDDGRFSLENECGLGDSDSLYNGYFSPEQQQEYFPSLEKPLSVINKRIGNNFLSAQKVYQKMYQMNNSETDDLTGATDLKSGTSDIRECARAGKMILLERTNSESEPLMNSHYLEEETTSQIKNFESDDGIATSTFMELFGDLF